MSSDPEIVKALELCLSANSDDLNSIDQYEIDKQEICPSVEHKCSYILLSINQFIEINYDSLKEVESLSFTSEEENLINSLLIENIIKLIPKLECISLNNQTLDSNAKELFIEKIAPKLQHMSIDDSTTKLSELFKNCTELTDLKLTTKYSQLDTSCLRELSSSVINFYFRDNFYMQEYNSDFNSDSNSDSVYYITNRTEKAIKYLSEGGAKNLQFLRLENDENEYSVITAYEEISKLSELRGLNLSMKNFLGDHENDFSDEFRKIGKLTKLETLTLKIHDSVQTEDFLRILSESAQFKTTLFCLRLIDAKINVKCIEYIVNNFNLKSLQFVDCVFRKSERKLIFKMITKFNRLNQLIVENNDLFTGDKVCVENSDCEYLGVQQIKYLINKCKHLDDLHYFHDFKDDKELAELKGLTMSKRPRINFTDY